MLHVKHIAFRIAACLAIVILGMPLDMSHAQVINLTADQWDGLGKKAFDAKDYPTAISDFQKAMQADAKNPLYVIDLAHAYVLSGQDAAGEHLLQSKITELIDPEAKNQIRRSLAHLENAWANRLISEHHDADAVLHWQMAYEIDQELDPMSAGIDLMLIATVYNELGQHSRAITSAQRSLEIERIVGNKKAQAKALDTLGSIYDDLYQWTQASDYFDQALVIERTEGDIAGEASTEQNIGFHYDRTAQYEKAIETYQTVLILHKKLSDNVNQVNDLLALASDYQNLSRFDEALHVSTEAQGIAEQNNDLFGRARVMSQLCFLYNVLQRYDKAIENYHLVIEIYHRLGDKHQEMMSLISLALAYKNTQKFDNALASLQQALILNKDDYNPDLLLEILLTSGDVYLAAKKYDQAISCADDAIRLSIECKNLQDQKRGFLLQGLSNIALGRTDRAQASFQQALQLSQGTSDFSFEGFILSNLGYIAYQSKKYDLALSYFRQESVLDVQVGRPQDLFYGMGALLFVLGETHKDNEAIFFGKLAVNSLQQMRDNLQSFDGDTRNRFNSNSANTSVYRELIELLIQQGRLTEAQQVMDLMKGKEYFDFIRRDAKEASSTLGTITLTAQEKTWQARYTQMAERVTVISQRRHELLRKQEQAQQSGGTFASTDLKALQLTVSDLKVASLAFQSMFTNLSAEFSKAPSKHPADDLIPSEFSATVKKLGPGTVALYTIVEPDKYRVIVITSQTQKAEEYTIDAHVLNKKVLALREALQDPDVDPRPLAHELYTILVGPIERDLQGANAKTLMWSLDGVLRYLPMAVLYDGQRYLVERYHNEVFTLASRSQFEDTAPTAWSALGFGVSQAHPGFDPLPAVPSELHGIIRDASDLTDGVLPGSVMLDDQFTRDTLTTNLAFRKYPVVHIASHFVFHPGNDTDSFLLLGDGTHLTLADIKTMPQVFEGVDLLTLSACDTAMEGDSADGREIEGCAVLAQRQGAHAVMASLWPVADASTQLLMRAFYGWRAAHPSATKGEALQQAQLALLHGDTITVQPLPGSHRGNTNAPADSAPLPDFNADPKVPFAHPYYWAPFILLGNWK